MGHDGAVAAIGVNEPPSSTAADDRFGDEGITRATRASRAPTALEDRSSTIGVTDGGDPRVRAPV
jgi:hypothetical protein